jgi:hypothetical protein
MLVESVKNSPGFLVDYVCGASFECEWRRPIAEYVNAGEWDCRDRLPEPRWMSDRMLVKYNRNCRSCGKRRKHQEQWDQKATTNDDWREH